MAHLSKRLLAVAVVVAVAATTIVVADPTPTAADTKDTSNGTWCVLKLGDDNVPDEEMKKLYDSLCSTPGVDCSATLMCGPCWEEGRYRHLASYAMNYHFHHVNGGRPESCVYGGFGQLVYEFPKENGGCNFRPQDDKSHLGPERKYNLKEAAAAAEKGRYSTERSKDGEYWYCVANASSSPEELQKVADEMCGEHIKCDPLKPGESCYEPNNPYHHASWALNFYYQGYSCDINSGCKHGRLTMKSHDTDKCIYLRGNHGHGYEKEEEEEFD